MHTKVGCLRTETTVKIFKPDQQEQEQQQHYHFKWPEPIVIGSVPIWVKQISADTFWVLDPSKKSQQALSSWHLKINELGIASEKDPIASSFVNAKAMEVTYLCRA